jgi:hypothetical protein
MDSSICHSLYRDCRVFVGHVVYLLAALVVLVTATPAEAQVSEILGRSTAGTIPSNGLSGDFKRASRFTLSAPSTAYELCAYLDGNGGVSGTQQVRLALYRDTSGAPGAKVMETDSWTVTSGTGARWYCKGQPYTPLPAASYWIAIQSGGTAGVVRDFYDGAPNWYGNADSFADGAASAFGAGSTGSGTLSVMARYYPNAEVRNAGRTTVGTIPSSGMTANFKRGSSFVMPEGGRLNAITVYLDGGGAPSSNDQQVYKYALYDDAGGVPNQKVYEGGSLYLRGGSAAGWRTATVLPLTGPALFPGRYWIVIHTGAVGGVVRNFADGTGNWYGNSETYANPGSESFGAGNPGNGTISAFVSYQPGWIDNGRMGRAQVASAPSSGLTANYLRWSEFVLNQDADTLTGLHAYLDGLGSASGSQALRMVLYKLEIGRDENMTPIDIYRKVAESEEVSIPAGMVPQWVHFPVAPVLMDPVLPVYLVGIVSGATGGIARDYGDVIPQSGFGGWRGMPDSYADGAIPEFLGSTPYSFSAVQLSVYASFSVHTP